MLCAYEDDDDDEEANKDDDEDEDDDTIEDTRCLRTRTRCKVLVSTSNSTRMGRACFPPNTSSHSSRTRSSAYAP